jgi:DNA excision repair protein ERCC-2
LSEEKLIKISVRNLVEFVLRSGDLDSSFSAGDRALEGARIHRNIQNSYGPTYTAEVTLAWRYETEEVVLEIAGRADGIIVEDHAVILDEIKSTTRDLAEIEENSHPLYWAQAKCYAFIYASQNHLETLAVQLTYGQLDTKQIKRFRKVFTLSELTTFFDDVVHRYLAWAKTLREWSVLRTQSIKAIDFPFTTYRKGQREFAVAAYRAIASGKKLFAQAPTGIGKTMAAIFPAIKAMGEDKIEKIFYLTARTTTRELAQAAIDRLREKNLKFKTITLTAKEKICFLDSPDCRPEVCPFAKGHYDRVNNAIVDIFSQDAITRSRIEEYARKHQVCPFEFSLDLSLFVDAVICDYNYVFDPKVYLRRFFQDVTGDYCFLVDEAHNLVDRAREMFSADFTKQPVLEMKRLLKKALPKVRSELNKINTVLLDIRKQHEEQTEQAHHIVRKEPYRDLLLPLRRFIKQSEKFLAKNEPADFRDALLDLYFKANDFIRTSELYDNHYATYTEINGSDVRVKLFCLDPSYLLSQAFKRGKSAILFSATLTPLDYFKTILGGEEGDQCLSVESPFPRENLKLIIENNIRTTYRAREQTYDQIVLAISAAIRQKTGNYLVYLPSYKYQNEIAQRFQLQNPTIEVLVQNSGMTDIQREAFLARFDKDNENTLIGFAVMGGIFGEGIDLVGDRLNGCIIVGVGLPQICLERDIIRNYFDDKIGLGFHYAYMYPGMNKVLQAAGRVIRTEHDRGFVLLIDQRFGTPEYRALFPAHWRDAKFVHTAREIEEELRAFYSTSA